MKGRHPWNCQTAMTLLHFKVWVLSLRTARDSPLCFENRVHGVLFWERSTTLVLCDAMVDLGRRSKQREANSPSIFSPVPSAYAVTTNSTCQYKNRAWVNPEFLAKKCTSYQCQLRVRMHSQTLLGGICYGSDMPNYLTL